MSTEISQDLYKILFDHSSDAHFILGEKGIIDCNDATVAMLKCRSKAEVLSIHPSRLSPEFQPDGRRSDEKTLEMDALARQNGVHRFEWVHRRMNGEDFPVQVTLNAVEIGGRPGLIAVWHDLTDIKRIETELRELNFRMKTELEAAAEVQRSFLPSQPVRSERFETAWFYQPCEELGGDCLNIFRIDERRVGAYVLDVTGHGVASALTSVTAMHLLAGFYKDREPAEAVRSLNRHCADEDHRHHGLTIVYGVLDLEERSFTYSSAGHIGPVRVTPDGTVESFGSHGLPVGILDDAEYAQTKIRLAPGDRLYLFSDGVYESRDASKREWGLEGVLGYLKKERAEGYTLEYTVSSLARAVYHRTLPQKPDDDISIVGIEIK